MKKTKTKAELRIEIAKDVLLQIEAKKIIAMSMKYFAPKTNNKYAGKQLQEVLPKIKKCEACAVGSIFYSYVTKHNNFEIDAFGIKSVQPDDNRELMSMFTLKQIRLIETAFEDGGFSFPTDYSDSVIERAGTYRERLGLLPRKNKKKDEQALIHIMKNIIRNKGTFKP